MAVRDRRLRRSSSEKTEDLVKDITPHASPEPPREEEKPLNKNKDVEEYESSMKELQEQYEKDKALIRGQIEEEEEEEERDTDKTLNRFIFWFTVVLIFANSLASYFSGSLSILSVLVDASMDLATSTIMGICLSQAHAKDPRYPRGKERLEIVGVVLCSVIMGIANIQMIVQSLESIVNGTVDPHMTLATMVILISGCSIKMVVMIICQRRGNKAAECLAMDLRNDILTGTVAIICAWLGDAYWKYADALGAMFVCGYIATSWIRNTLEHIPLMVGVTADKEHMSRILKIALDHDERIQKIDHVMIYHIGAKSLVELHIVMDETLPLKITHDISHYLETKLNMLEFVERSFVHCDYTCDGDH